MQTKFMLPPQRVYLPFEHGQWRLKMGLKPLKLEEWIEIDQEFNYYLNTKNELLQKYHSQIFDSLPSSMQAQQETLELLVDHLLKYFPHFYQRQGNQINNLLTEQQWNISDFTENPLDLAGRLIQEDLCLMQPSSEGYTLVAGSVCLPFHWWFPDKLGKAIAHLHQRVPEYPQKLERHVDSFFHLLQVDYPGYRLNWGIIDTPQLCLGLPKNSTISDAPITINNIDQRLWIRLERQTLRRLEKSNHVLFTIRTYLYPLSILANNLKMAQGLLAQIQQMPLKMQSYKELTSISQLLINYLEQL